MQSMTLEQLRATARAGGVKDVCLRGRGDGFFIEMTTLSGQEAFLVKARSTQPRRFGNPTSALTVLRSVGLVLARLDATHWEPAPKRMAKNKHGQQSQHREHKQHKQQAGAEAPRGAHEAAAPEHQPIQHKHQPQLSQQPLAAEIREALDDPRPGLPHDEVMARMDARIAQRKLAGAQRV